MSNLPALTNGQLIAARNALAMSQEALATSLGLSVSTVRRWEQNKQAIPLWLSCWLIGYQHHNNQSLTNLDSLSLPKL